MRPPFLAIRGVLLFMAAALLLGVIGASWIPPLSIGNLGGEPGPAQTGEHLLQREEPNRQAGDSVDAPQPSPPEQQRLA